MFFTLFLLKIILFLCMKSSVMATTTLLSTHSHELLFWKRFSKEMRFSCLCFTYHHLESHSHRDACHETEKKSRGKHPPKQILWVLSLAHITTHWHIYMNFLRIFPFVSQLFLPAAAELASSSAYGREQADWLTENDQKGS